nr:MAG TPA: hypothetical protein [Caudoviricetes sp.]DAY30021.1 MAG TPA: hypothetical protein [Caudoviricetes sp.]
MIKVTKQHKRRSKNKQSNLYGKNYNRLISSNYK